MPASRADSLASDRGLPHVSIRKLRNTLAAAAMLAWPLIVYWGLRHLSVRAVALLLLAAVLARFGAGRATRPDRASGAGDRIALAAVAVLTLAAFAFEARLPLKLYPVAINAMFLAAFAWSLYRGPPLVERLARSREPDLAPAGVAYTRYVTQAWCAFFVVNGGIALGTAIAASDEVWALYNGVIAYVLIGAMFSGEWLLRRRLRRKWNANA